jgi:competence protein ComEA
MMRESRAAWRGYLAMAFVAVAVLAAAGAGFLFLREPAPSPVEILPPATSVIATAPVPTVTTIVTPRPLRVDVAGAVTAPGVYRLPPDSIVADAIAAAGGPAKDADLDRLNKAIPLLDGVQVYVPHRGVTPPPTVALTPPPSAVPSARSGDVPLIAPFTNINTASQAELEALSGIGPVLAQRIIAGRPYQRVEDLLDVKGIGPAVYEKISSQITVQ